MNLSRKQKIWIGVLTFMPILFFIGYFVSFLIIFMSAMDMEQHTLNNNAPPKEFFAGFTLAFVSIGLAVLSGIASFILHIVHVVKNEKLKKQDNGQLLWILVIVLANGIGGIIYYFVEILPEPKQGLSIPDKA